MHFRLQYNEIDDGKDLPSAIYILPQDVPYTRTHMTSSTNCCSFLGVSATFLSVLVATLPMLGMHAVLLQDAKDDVLQLNTGRARMMPGYVQIRSCVTLFMVQNSAQTHSVRTRNGRMRYYLSNNYHRFTSYSRISTAGAFSSSPAYSQSPLSGAQISARLHKLRPRAKNRRLITGVAPQAGTVVQGRSQTAHIDRGRSERRLESPWLKMTSSAGG